MIESTELYDLLQVEPTSDVSVIKKAYRVMALKYHPDKNNLSDESKKMFQKICEAYEVLSNPEKREMYDNFGTVDPHEIETIMAKRKEKEQQMGRTRNGFGNDPFFNHGMGMGMNMGMGMGMGMNMDMNMDMPNLGDLGNMGMGGYTAGDLFSQFFDNNNKSNSKFNQFDASNPTKNSIPGRNSGVFGNRNNSSNFNSFFNSINTNVSNNNISNNRNMKRGPDIKHTLRCTLRDLYLGKRMKLRLDRTRCCFSCNGMGSLKISSCSKCNGNGSISQTRSMGPMVQTFTQTCTHCGGNGTFAAEKDICTNCQGEGFINERKIFEVEITPGMVNGQVIILTGEADEVLKTNLGKEKVTPGDIILTINQLPDLQFKVVKGSDLLYPGCKINLLTSLCGGSIYIKDHPGGKLLKVDIVPGELIKSGAIKSIDKLGMPIPTKNTTTPQSKKLEEPTMYGNLHIQFEIIYPEKLETDTVIELQNVLNNDKYIQEQVTKEEEITEKNLEDVMEYEEHVFNNFVLENKDIDDFIEDKTDEKIKRPRQL